MATDRADGPFQCALCCAWITSRAATIVDGEIVCRDRQRCIRTREYVRALDAALAKVRAERETSRK